jgi:hypothetical protein
MEDGSNCILWGRREKTVDRREKKITSPGFCETTLQRNQKNESTKETKMPRANRHYLPGQVWLSKNINL